MKILNDKKMTKSTFFRLVSVLGFPVMLLMALDKIVDIGKIIILIAISFTIAGPLCVLAWKYRARLFSKDRSTALALTIPVAMILSKWLSAKSPTATVILGLTLDIFLIFISFSFEEEYLK